MSKSADLFLMLREQEIHTERVYPTKKEIQKTSADFVQRILDEGEHDTHKLLSQAIRLKEALIAIEKKLRDSVPQEDFEAYGLKGTYVDGGNIPQYEEDEVYYSLKKKLKERENLLKTALKQSETLYDSEGVEVPKVSVKPRKSSLTIKF